MIYLVEDDDSIRELVLYTLHTTGLEASGFSRAKDFWEEMERNVPSLILLDIMLPDEDGLTILRKLKMYSATKKIPVIMLTAKGTEYDKVVGLDGGADDYIPKPFGMMELISRIKAVLRRTQPEPGEHVLEYGDIQIDVDKHQVTAGKEVLNLTLKEFELLRYLIKNKGFVLSRDKILSSIWGYDIEVETRTVDVHIRTLRQKLGKYGEVIETVRGVGYRIGGKNA
ncbi:MAG: winged helix-turn-helix domain-containing protein [Lachnospiraceae bacterium]|jgi:two-component system alkaline phosphatase synthesis response regulator PhoP